MRVPLTAVERAASAFRSVGSSHVDDLYWVLRLSLVHDVTEIEIFDRVFGAVFGAESSLLRDKNRPRQGPGHEDDAGWTRLPQSTEASVDGGSGLPWLTLPPVVADADEADDTEDVLALPELRPSAAVAEVDRPFDALDDTELRRIGLLLEQSVEEWPGRRSRRRRVSHSGAVALRHSLRRARRTGGEIATLVHSEPTERPRPAVVLLDVSGSMENHARAYLHLTRPLAQRHQAEVFAFATTLTRITPTVRLRSPEAAIDTLNDLVGDRFSGTRLASSLTALVRHPTWSTALRGAVVLICSDGWDSDPPDQLARAMARLHRVSYRVVWVNPRAAAPGFEPRTGGMAAALPYCDAFLPGNTARSMGDVIAALARPGRRRAACTQPSSSLVDSLAATKAR
jgi:uncharacterized protein with von Willebrand factor type A (vWA) domain